MRLRIFVIIFLVTQTVNAKEWKWDSRIRSDGVAIVVQSSEGHNSLKDAISSVPKDICIQHVRVSFLTQYEGLQKDLHSYMLVNYPSELKAALVSAGNMHNPKVIELREVFAEAVMASNFVKQINFAFIGRHEKITSTSFEKFFIRKRADTPEYEAMLWLTTEQCN